MTTTNMRTARTLNIGDVITLDHIKHGCWVTITYTVDGVYRADNGYTSLRLINHDTGIPLVRLLKNTARVTVRSTQ